MQNQIENKDLKIKTLRIKKKYYDLIKNGNKIFEYREFKNYYHKFFSEKFDALKFHYQGKEKMVIEFKFVEIIQNDNSFEFLKTEKIYKVHLGKLLMTYEN